MGEGNNFRNFVELVHRRRSAFNWSTAGRGPFSRQEDEEELSLMLKHHCLHWLSSQRLEWSLVGFCFRWNVREHRTETGRWWWADVDKGKWFVYWATAVSLVLMLADTDHAAVLLHLKKNNVLLSGLSVYNSSNTGCGVCSVNYNNPHSETLIIYNVLVKKSDRFVVSFLLRWCSASSHVVFSGHFRSRLREVRSVLI